MQENRVKSITRFFIMNQISRRSKQPSDNSLPSQWYKLKILKKMTFRHLKVEQPYLHLLKLR